MGKFTVSCLTPLIDTTTNGGKRMNSSVILTGDTSHSKHLTPLFDTTPMNQCKNYS